MKNYVIGSLAVCIALLLSFMYKASISPVLKNFPIEGIEEKSAAMEPSIYLFIFFSRHNCNVCLEAIEVLNELKLPFIVTGIVPEEELKDERGFRNTTGAAFHLISNNGSYRKFNPNYQPTIYGVSGSGRIFFVLPGVPGEKEYLKNFLMNFYTRILDYLILESNN
jgi:hypothetical protein